MPNSAFDPALLAAIATHREPKIRQVALLLQGALPWETRPIPKTLFNRSTIEKVQRLTGMRLRTLIIYEGHVMVTRVPNDWLRYNVTRKKNATDRTMPRQGDDNWGGAR